MQGSTAVVADKEEFFSAGLCAVLKRQVGYSQVLEARTLDELIEILAEVPVDLVITADDIPGCRGTETIQQLSSHHAGLRVAVVTRSMEARDILSLLAAGAHGVISRHNDDCTELLRALRTVSDAGISVPPLEELEDRQEDHRADPDPLSALTRRQRQVIDLLSEGHANKVIARELGISPSTVKVHVHAAFRTLGVHNRMAAAHALRPMPSKTATRF